MFIRQSGFSERELDHFRTLQRRSFAILEDTAAGLREGQTELEVGRALFRRYREAGAASFFHLPVVLFGERTALPGKVCPFSRSDLVRINYFRRECNASIGLIKARSALEGGIAPTSGRPERRGVRARSSRAEGAAWSERTSHTRVWPPVVMPPGWAPQ